MTAKRYHITAITRDGAALNFETEWGCEVTPTAALADMQDHYDKHHAGCRAIVADPLPAK